MTPARRPSTSSSIWEEPLEKLARRWEARGLADGGVPSLSAADLVEEVEQRFNRVHASVFPNRPYVATSDGTERLGWPAGWSLVEREKAIGAAYRRLDCSYQVIDDEAPLSPSVHGRISRKKAVIMAETARKLACPFEVTADQAILVLLAEDLFRLAAPRVGRQPSDPIIDEVARHTFAQRVVALPFNPWVLDLI